MTEAQFQQHLKVLTVVTVAAAVLAAAQNLIGAM